MDFTSVNSIRRYGYRRITALLRRKGIEVNAKRLARIRREEGLKVRKRQSRPAGALDGGAAAFAACSAGVELGFVENQTENGSRFRILTLIDEHTRESLTI
jgi:transposase InsO family protein